MPGFGIGISPYLRRGGRASPSEIGTIIDSDNVSDSVFSSGSWTQEGVNITPTFSSNSINLDNTVGAYSDLIRYNLWYTQLEEFTVRCIVTMNDVSANSVYFGIGLAGVSSFSSKMCIRGALWSNNAAENGLMQLYYGSGNGTNVVVADSGASRLSFVQGDSIEMEVSQSGLTATFTCRNLTNPGGDLVVTWTNSNAIVYPGTVNTQLLNIEQIALWNYKGDYTVTDLKYISNEYKNVNGCLVGDSKSEGYYVDSLANRISNILATDTGTYFQVSAGSGNVTQDVLNSIDEIILLNPAKLVLCIGRNDLANSVPSGTWQANYSSIVSQLQAAGIDVYHQIPFTEVTLDQSSLATWISANYPAPKVIPLPSGWSTATDVSPDGVHLTVAGALKAANNIFPYI